MPTLHDKAEAEGELETENEGEGEARMEGEERGESVPNSIMAPAPSPDSLKQSEEFGHFPLHVDTDSPANFP